MGIRFKGSLGRARIRLGTGVVRIAGWIAAALIDLGLAIAPEIAGAFSSTRRGTWLGLLIILLLALDLVLAGQAGVWIVTETFPHRESRP